MLDSLGYYGSGDPIRGFDFETVREQLAAKLLDYAEGSVRSGKGWHVFDVASTQIAADGTKRWDRKYWEPKVRERTVELLEEGGRTLETLNTLETSRGRSPSSSLYVDEADGYAVVIKAGSCISRYGQVLLENADWIEKATFDDMPDSVKLQVGDILISSTGYGTLGKTAVYDSDYEAIADSHVTIVRVDPTTIDPYYLADYLRAGFGHDQIYRLFTGSTRLIELTADQVNRIIVPVLTSTDGQRQLSKAWRAAEKEYIDRVDEADKSLDEARSTFRVAASGGLEDLPWQPIK
jgi:type I restriction enzyme M protein